MRALLLLPFALANADEQNADERLLQTTLGGYTFLADQTDSDTKFSDMSLDIKAVEAAIANYANVKTVYEQGQHVCLSARPYPTAACDSQTLQKFATTNCAGEGFFDAFSAFYGSPTSWDDFMQSAFQGTGKMGTHPTSFTDQAVKKGTQGIMVLQLMHMLESAVKLAATGARADTEAPKIWDDAFGLFYGADGTGSPYSGASKRDTNYPTGVQVAPKLITYFKQGQKALQEDTYDADKATDALTQIRRLLTIVAIRNMDKYSYNIWDHDADSPGTYSGKYHGEAYLFARAFLPWIGTFDNAVATKLESLMSAELDAATVPADVYCQVRTQLETVLPKLGLDCTMIGSYSGIPADKCGACTVAAAAAIPDGATDWVAYAKMGTYQPRNDVKEVADIATDVDDISSALPTFASVQLIYENGQNSATGTLKAYATAVNTGNAWFDAYKSFYSSDTAHHDYLAAALAGTGVAVGKSDTFRSQMIQKTCYGIQVLATMNALETGISMAAAGTRADTGAPLHWDTAFAMFYGDAKYSPYGAIAKRDTDFPDGVQVEPFITPLFQQGQKASTTAYSGVKASEAGAEIKRIVTIATVRNAIKYAYLIFNKVDPPVFSDKYHGEAYTYWRFGSGWVASHSDAAAAAALQVDNLLSASLTDSTMSANVHCAVREALEAVYADLDIDCAMVGEYKSWTLAQCAVACAATGAAAIVTGSSDWGDYAPIGAYLPVSDTLELADIILDNKAVKTALPTWETATTIYTSGQYSEVSTGVKRNLKSFNGNYAGEPWFDAWKSYYGSDAPWDDYISAALAGTGAHAGKSDTFREQVILKGIFGLLVYETMHLLQHAVTLGVAGDRAGAAAAWDQAYAVYYGADGTACPYETQAKRDTDYPDGVAVAPLGISLLKQGQKALTAYSSVLVSAALTEFQRAFTVTFVRAAIKYSYLIFHKTVVDGVPVYSEKYHAEGHAYFSNGAAWIASLGDDADARARSKAAVDTILAALSIDLTKDTMDANMHCTVRVALESIYEDIGVDCGMIGEYKSWDTTYECERACVAETKPASALAIVAGKFDWGDYAPIGEYVPVSEVAEVNEMSLDYKAIKSAVASSFETGYSIYQSGANSVDADGNAVTFEQLAKKTGGAWADAFTAFYGSAASWDAFIKTAFLETGDFSGKSVKFREQGVLKGIYGIQVHEAMRLLDEALALGKAGSRADTGAVHKWDSAWAMLYGIPAAGAVYSAFGKRDSDYSDGFQVEPRLLPLFRQGQKALRSETYSEAEAVEARDGIFRLVTITVLRCAIKYGWSTLNKDPGVYSEKYHSEGNAYTRVGLAWIASYDTAAGQLVADKLDPALGVDTFVDPTCDVKTALEGVYEKLGVDCDMVGTFKGKDLGCACSAPAAEAIPMGVYAIGEMGGYTPDADVVELTQILDDVKGIVSAADTSYDTVQSLYTAGGASEKADGGLLTLQEMATADYTGEAYFDSFEAFYGSKKSFDDFMLAAIAGEGNYAPAHNADAFRNQCVKKAMYGILQAESAHLVELAFQQGTSGGRRLSAGPATWDKAWAIMYGTDGTYSVFGNFGSRDTNYPDGLVTQTRLIALMKQGQQALASGTYDATAAQESVEAIQRLMVIANVRNTIKYSYLIMQKTPGTYSAKYHGEGYAFWRQGAGWMAKYDAANAQLIEEMLAPSYNAATFAADTDCKVKAALEAMYPALGIDCSMVGNFVDMPVGYCPACSAPAATPIPDGLSDGVSVCKSAGSCATGMEWDGRCSCVLCRAGWYNPQMGDECKPCAPGFFAEVPGSFSCTACPKGSFAGGDVWAGNTACELCDAGTFAASPGAASCTPCMAGYFESEEGSHICTACARGTYSTEEQSLECTSCPATQSTEELAASSIEQCTCVKGTYLTSAGVCVECPEGAQCPGGSDWPLQAEGFHAGIAPNYRAESLEGTEIEEDLTIFRCFVGSERCPAGPLGECAEGRHGLQCALCEKGKSPRDDGSCQDCGAGGIMVFILLMVIAFVVLLVMYRNVEKESGNRAHSTLLVVITFGLLITCVQQIAVIDMLSIEFRPPISYIMNFLRIFSFDIQVLQISCIAEPSSMALFAGEVCILFAGVGVLFVVHLAYVTLFHNKEFKKKLPNFICAGGFVFVTFFISVSVTITAPFQCISHPNAFRTVRRYATVVCGEKGDHTGMMILSLIMAIPPLAFLGLVLWAARQYPKRMTLGDMAFLNSYRFLFDRYKAEAYWYTAAFLIRNLLLALTPILPSPVAQLSAIQIILVVSLVIVSNTFPWRLWYGNILDICITVGLIAFVTFGSFFVEEPDVEVLSVVCFVVVIIMFVAFLMTATYGAVLQYREWKIKKRFQYFICHHKEGAGAFARLLKIVLTENTNREVFIDSDNLDNLDQLFDFVRSQSENLVVLCTRSILSRPWCLGEITCTWMNQASIACKPIVFPDFAEPSDEFLDRIDQDINLDCLTQNSISVTQVRDALLWFKGLVSSKDAYALEDNVIRTDALGELTSHLLAKEVKLGALGPTQPTTVSLLVDGTNREAIATAQILVKMCWQHAVQMNLVRFAPTLVDAETLAGTPREALSGDVDVLLILCTNGCFLEEKFLRALDAATDRDLRYLPIIGDESFRFPGPTFYAAMKKTCEMAGVRNHISVTVLLQSVFKEIACLFRSHSSAEILSTESRAIVQRAAQIAQSMARSQSRNPTPRSPGDNKGAYTAVAEPAEPAEHGGGKEIEV
jgi:hypothetical protein